MKNIRVGVLTVSDSCAAGSRADLGGPAIARGARGLGWTVARQEVVPDRVPGIVRRLRAWSSAGAVDVILTTGGTGLGPRDVTPEATRAVIKKEVPGIPEALRREGARHTPLAALSRAVCGVLGRTLILNLPGSPRSLDESFPILEAVIPHALEMMSGGGHPHPGRHPRAGGRA